MYNRLRTTTDAIEDLYILFENWLLCVIDKNDDDTDDQAFASALGNPFIRLEIKVIFLLLRTLHIRL